MIHAIFIIVKRQSYFKTVGNKIKTNITKLEKICSYYIISPYDKVRKAVRNCTIEMNHFLGCSFPVRILYIM